MPEAHACVPVRRCYTLTLSLLLVACTARQGPPFDEVFPDPGVLVTTNDPASLRKKLDTVQLPETRAHHDRLLALLHGRDHITAAHLVLLTHAVATPDRIIVGNGNRVWRYGARGQGEFAPVIEQLLGEGIDKVTDVDRRWLGELLGVSQSDATLRRYADRFLAQVDDGSPQALGEILEGMPGSPAAIPFLVGYLAPKGGLDGERGWSAFARMEFDEQRTAVLDAVLARQAAIDGERMVAVMKAFSFDSGREIAFAQLAAKTQPLPVGAAKEALATFSFDSGRNAAFAALGKQAGVHLTDGHLVEFVQLCAFDSGKLQCLKSLAPRLDGAPDAAAAKALLAAFSFDSDRKSAVEVMREHWSPLPAGEREALLATFSFESNREAAAQLLR
ncbi:MAG TPA: DUF4476 domain-containing protein [Gemmatimonadaceae bacterium]